MGAVVSTFLGKDKRIVISFHLVFKIVVGCAEFFTFFVIERTNRAKNQKLIIAILGILRVLRVEKHERQWIRSRCHLGGLSA
jgi:hypothetical protein